MKSWDEFLESMRGYESILDQTVAPVDEQLRADLIRQFALNLSQGYFLLVAPDPRYPEFLPFENHIYSLQPNPDATYHLAVVDGRGTYRVTGERGSTRVAGFATGRNILGTGKGQGFDNYDVDKLTLDPDGRFDAIFSGSRPDGHDGDWLKLHPDADFILLRQFAYDWGNEREMRIAIERIDKPADFPLLRPRISPEELDRRMERLSAFVKDLSVLAMGAVRRPFEQGYVNTMHLHDFQDLGNGGDWPQSYFETCFDLSPDEALVIETELPETHHYWNVQVIDGLWHQVDVPYRQSSLNGHTAHVSEDGKVRMVLSSQDPGYLNWLDTGGNPFGLLIGRWYRCSSHPTPDAKKMKLGEVEDYIGDRTARISSAGRAAQLRERLIGTQLRRKW